MRPAFVQNIDSGFLSQWKFICLRDQNCPHKMAATTMGYSSWNAIDIASFSKELPMSKGHALANRWPWKKPPKPMVPKASVKRSKSEASLSVISRNSEIPFHSFKKWAHIARSSLQLSSRKTLRFNILPRRQPGITLTWMFYLARRHLQQNWGAPATSTSGAVCRKFCLRSQQSYYVIWPISPREAELPWLWCQVLCRGITVHGQVPQFCGERLEDTICWTT